MHPKDARLKRGWSIYQAAKKMDGVSVSSIQNLERNDHVGERLELRTALKIMELYWPDVKLEDLMPWEPVGFKLIRLKNGPSKG